MTAGSVTEKFMAKIKFLTDSNCDIPLPLAQELGIEILPFTITIDGREYQEAYSFTPSEYYRLLEASSDLPKTAQLSPAQFLAAFERAYAEGYTDAICTTMTSVGSGTYQKALLARSMFGELHPEERDRFAIHVIDSANYSISYGYGVILGARAALSGGDLTAVLAEMNGWFRRLETYFTVFNLKYIRKSGRIGPATHVIGEMMGIKPVLSNLNGTFKTEKMARGKALAIQGVADFFARRRRDGTDYVILRGVSDAEAQRLAALTTEICGYPPVGIFYAGPSISTNTGIEITGIGFCAKGI